jgi:uncharacterized protein
MSNFLLILSLLLSSLATTSTKTVDEKWPDGSLKTRQEMAQDMRGRMVPNGLETHYGVGGIKLSEVTYRFGVKEGPWRDYYINGKVQAQGNYHHGDKDGVETTYNENGQKASEITYKNGQRDGPKTEWQGPTKVYQAQYDKDRLVGTVQEWYMNGKPKSVRHYKDGLLEGPEQSWYSDGRKYIEAKYSAGEKDGDYREWFQNGQPKYSAEYKHGQPNGKFQEWFDDGALKSTGQYVDGEMDGTWKDWQELPDIKPKPPEDSGDSQKKPVESAYASTDTDFGAGKGSKSASATASGGDSKTANSDAKSADAGKDGEQKSDAKTADSKDKKPPKEHPLSGEHNYKHGVMEGTQITYQPGSDQKQLEVSMIDGKKEGPYTEWYPNGQVRSTGHYKNDDLNGEINYWFEDGKPWAVNNYFRGSPVGHWIEWDRDGNVVSR